MPRPIIIPAKDKCVLITNKETHDVIAYHALKCGLTLQQATHDLLEVGITKIYGVGSVQFLEKKT